MPTFKTWQQLPPRQLNGEWQAHLVRRDDVPAATPVAAIAIARNLECFRRAQGGARFPLVEEMQCNTSQSGLS